MTSSCPSTIIIQKVVAPWEAQGTSPNCPTTTLPGQTTPCTFRVTDEIPNATCWIDGCDPTISINSSQQLIVDCNNLVEDYRTCTYDNGFSVNIK